MSWLAKLYETYEAGKRLDLSTEERLMPISHTLQNAHINIVIDKEGNFKRASVLEKTQIVLPATEKSAGRTSGEAPHPLADKIQYVARDYPVYGGRKKSFFESYKKLLGEWCDSQFSHPKAVAVYRYISKGQVVADLIQSKIFYVDTRGKLLAYWPHETDREHPPPLIFKVLPTIPKNKRVKKDQAEVEPGDALVCWSVETPGEPEVSTWRDETLQQSWMDFCASSNDTVDLCYIQGESQPLAVNHPAKLRHTGDKAKLISSNDSSGFTFRGRFTDGSGLQAAGIGYEVTQKAHNALRWLISRQGYRNGEQVFVTWAVSGKAVPEPMKSSWDLLSPDYVSLSGPVERQENDIDHTIDLGSSFARNFNKYLAGYKAHLEPTEQIVIMGLDSATPGRMGIIYYRELLASEFLDRLQAWHHQFAWPQRQTIEMPSSGKRKKKEKKTIWLISCPSPLRIAEAAYGDVLKSNETLKKSVLERIVPCIVEGRPFPRDVMISTIRRACKKHVLEHWEWEINLGVACALYRGYHLRHPDIVKQEEYDMALEEERTTRDYLYGRLLAIAERIEEIALGVAGENRPTTAARLMQRFADHPFSTWRTIELALQPYMQRLQSKRIGFLKNRQKELDTVLALFESDEFISDQPLDGEFLLGYHCQKRYWRENKGEDTTIEHEQGE